MNDAKPTVVSSKTFNSEVETARGTGVTLYLVKFRGGVNAYLRTWEDNGMVLKMASPEAALEPEHLEQLSQECLRASIELRKARANQQAQIPAQVMPPVTKQPSSPNLKPVAGPNVGIRH